MTNYQAIEEQILKYVGPDSIVGMSLAIVQGDEVVYTNGFGVTSIEDGGIPVTTQTLFSIGSTSKTLNALMIMRLIEQGILDLDKPVVEYLPGYVFTDNPAWGKRVTLRHLLSHTAGLASGGKGWGPRDLDALRCWVWDEMAHFAFLAEPGRVPYYANGPCFAAHVAEAVTGKYFPQLVEEQLFTPLGMTRSTYDRLVAMTYPLALPHGRDDDGKLSVLHHFADNPAGNPDGFCLSTAEDMIKPLLVLLNQGRFGQGQFLIPDSVKTMQTIQGNYRTAPITDDVRAAMMLYEGIGLSIGHYKGVPTFGHSGMLQGMSTMMDIFPDQGIGVFCVSNHCNMGKRNETLFQLYDQLLATPTVYNFPMPRPLTADAHQANWSQYEGTYLSPLGTLATVAIQDGELTATIEDETHNLTAVTPEQYYFMAEGDNRMAVAFLAEEAGPVQIMLVNGDIHNRFEEPPSTIQDGATLSTCAGLYTNYVEGNMLAGFYLRVKEDGLYVYPAEKEGLRIPLAEENGTRLRPLSPTKFAGDWVLYEFEFDDEGAAIYVTKERAFRYWRVNGRDEEQKVNRT